MALLRKILRAGLFLGKTTLPRLCLGSLLLITSAVPSLLHAQEVRAALPLQSSPEEQARFLAGQPLGPASALAGWQATEFYFRHLQEFQKHWRRFESEHFLPKRNWAATEMAALAPRSDVLFYLFSGPDILNAVSLFPDVTNYLLVGLEPVGSITPPETLSEEAIAKGLENLRKATETTLAFSFFITKDMRVDLEQTEFRGVLPVLYSFLSLTGYRILSVEHGGLDSSGRWIAGKNPALPGVKIRFADPATSLLPKTLTYIRGDLSNSGLRGPSAPLLRWLRSHPKGASYLKAASYLLHETYFSEARDFLLTHSISILQDDSGIPLRFFAPDLWSLFYFGTYTRPIELFDGKFQPELRRSYELAGGGRPLPFGTGYNWKPGESNLLLAVRKGTHPVPSASPASPASPTQIPPQSPTR